MRSPFPSSPSLSSTDGGAEDQVDHPSGGSAEQRRHLRLDKVFLVRLESSLFGEMTCVARNVSQGGIFIEMSEPLPLSSSVRVCFPMPDGTGDVVALGEVKNHYFLNFSQDGVSKAISGMAVRFTSFESDGQDVLRDCLGRLRVLH